MIFIKEVNPFPNASFLVKVESDKTTEHKVGLEESYYQKLTEGKVAPEKLIKKSFEFLLAREPNTSILRSFDLPMIGQYFPEYEKEIKK